MVDKESRNVTRKPHLIQAMSCGELAEILPDLVLTSVTFDPDFTTYPYHRINLDVDLTAARITKRVRAQLKQGGSHE